MHFFLHLNIVNSTSIEIMQYLISTLNSSKKTFLCASQTRTGPFLFMLIAGFEYLKSITRNQSNLC